MPSEKMGTLLITFSADTLVEGLVQAALEKRKCDLRVPGVRRTIKNWESALSEDWLLTYVNNNKHLAGKEPAPTYGEASLRATPEEIAYSDRFWAVQEARRKATELLREPVLQAVQAAEQAVPLPAIERPGH